MRIVAALGGNAFLKRGEPNTLETQRYHVRRAARALATLAADHTLIITHGNGPQVGLLACQAAAAGGAPYPLDVLGAESEGMIGYLLEQELGNALGTRDVATLLTRTEVRPDDPAFQHPTKFIGPAYTREQAGQIASKRDWHMAADGQCWRRVVASPEPINIVELAAIQHLQAGGFIVICAGGGGIPVVRAVNGELMGVECVIDKDLVAAQLAGRTGADCLLLLTDVPAVFDDWGTAKSRPIRAAHPDELAKYAFPAGSMGPKVEAARRFALHTGGRAHIGALEDAAALVAGHAGTCVSTDIRGLSIDEPLAHDSNIRKISA
jgi:carbamate kinase